MLLSFCKNLKCKINSIRRYSSPGSALKVTVIGAAGRVGKPLCLLLKQSPLIDELCLHDLKDTEYFGAELNLIDTKCKVTSYCGKNIAPALADSKIIVIVASAPGSRCLNMHKMWLPNAHIMQEIIADIGRFCPKALLAINTNPINSIIPMACEILKKCGCYNPNGIFGITTLDVIRTNTMVAQVLGLEPECVSVPVIGGRSEDTLVPVLSQSQPCAEFEDEELENITKTIRKAHDTALKRANPVTAPHLSEAFATGRFVISLVKACKGTPNVVECAFVPSNVYRHTKYFATPILLGSTGLQKNLGIPKMSDYEFCLLDNTIKHLIHDCQKGEMYVGVEDTSVLCAEININPNYRCDVEHCEKMKR